MTIADRLGLSFPMLQAPMAGVQGSALAIAVANAGGLGSLPCAMLTVEEIARELAAFRAHARGPINVNFFCHPPPGPDANRLAGWRAALAPYYAELGVDPALAAGASSRTPFDLERAAAIAPFAPEVVSFHFGLPSAELLAEVRRWGALVFASATTVDEARWLEAHGADVIIAQGLQAGGHRGHFLRDDVRLQLATFELLPQVVATVRVPVVATGGIADAADVRRARELGAAGVQVGSAYLRSPEATTSAVHRRALASPSADHTELTNVFSGRPARGIVNRLMRELGPMSALAPEFPLAGAAVAPLRAAAERLDRDDFSSLWAGTRAGRCEARPAAEITEVLARGWHGSQG